MLVIKELFPGVYPANTIFQLRFIKEDMRIIQITTRDLEFLPEIDNAGVLMEVKIIPDDTNDIITIRRDFITRDWMKWQTSR